MTSSKATKRALISSTLALLMCVAMLIGTTFAWFTDTASTAVNKIQAGNLDVDLEMSTDGTNWESAEGKTLTFKTKDNRAADQILWEPGCTYELPQLRNEGRSKRFEKLRWWHSDNERWHITLYRLLGIVQ